MNSFSFKFVGLMIVAFGSVQAFAQAASCEGIKPKANGYLTELQGKCNVAKGMKNAVDGQNDQRIIDESGSTTAIHSGAEGLAASAGMASQTAWNAFEICMEAHGNFNKQMKSLMNDVNKAAEDPKNAQACEKAKADVKKTAEAGYKIAKTEGTQLLSAMNAADKAKAQATLTAMASDGDDGDAGADEGFTWKDAAKWGAIAGVAGVGAMALLGGGGGSSKPNQSYTGSNNGGTGGTGNNGNGQTPTVDCNNLSAAAASASCDTQTVVTCNTVTKIKTSDCQTFSNRYCGLDGSANPVGVGTSYCRAASAYQFCATSGRDTCASCIQVAQWNSPACATNPSSNCAAQFSPAQLTALQGTAACGSDPIYADASVFQPTNPLLPPPVLPSSLGSNSVKRSVASQSLGAAYGSSLLNSNSESLKEMCKANQLVNCHSL